MNLFWKNKVRDERVTNLQNKIYKEIYFLVLAISMVSVVVKTYIYGMGTDSIYTEMVILLASGIHFSYRSVSLGIFSDEVEMHDRTSKMSIERKILIIGVIAITVMALVIATRNTILYGGGISAFFLIFLTTLVINTPFFILFMLISHSVMKKKSAKAVNKQLDELDDDDGDSDEKH